MSSQHASTSYSICHYDTLDVPNFDIAPKGWLDALCAGKDLEENTENEAISKSHRSVNLTALDTSLDNFDDSFDEEWMGELPTAHDVDKSLADMNDSADEDFLSQLNSCRVQPDKAAAASCSLSTQAEIRSHPLANTSTVSIEDSPIKPVRKRRKKTIIESDDSDEDNAHPSNDSTRNLRTVNKQNSTVRQSNTQDLVMLIDSDSDLEILEEDWRPPSLPSGSGNDNQFTPDSNLEQTSRLVNETLDFLQQDSPAQLEISTRLSLRTKPSSQTFKMPELPLAPNRKHVGQRPGLRVRSNSQLNSRSKPLSHNNTQNYSTSSRVDKTVDGRGGTGRAVKRRVHVSIEEELVGEAHSDHESEDEDSRYTQRACGALIETEAQCSGSEEDSEESDGELESSFINDQSIMSQQLSQDSMHGVYLRSLRRY